MGFIYLANKRDFDRQLRARRAAEIANGGGLGTVKLPPIRRNLRGRLLCERKLVEGTPIILSVKNDLVVGLQENVPTILFDRVNKATMKRLQRHSFAIGQVRRMHLYTPTVDVCVDIPRTADHS